MTEYDDSPAAHDRVVSKRVRVSNWVSDTVQQSQAYSNPFEPDGSPPSRHPHNAHDECSTSSSRLSRSRSRSIVDRARYDHTRNRSKYQSRSPASPEDIQAIYPPRGSRQRSVDQNGHICLQLTDVEHDSKMIEINTQHTVCSVSFAENGKQVLSGGYEGKLRRWRAADGHEVGEAIPVKGAEIYAAALSPDRKWLVCGLRRLDPRDGRADVRVWDAQTHEKALDIDGHTDTVMSIDIAPDSSKFATGSADTLAFTWNMTTGKRLVGPLQHEGRVVTVRFSPNADRIATAATKKSIRIYDGDNGHQLFDIPFPVQPYISSSIAWSGDGCQLLAVSNGEAKRFDAFSAKLLSEWPIHAIGHPVSIALAHNQKFAVISARDSLSFWDTSTNKQIGTIVRNSSPVCSIALSPKDDCVVTAERNGKITLRRLRGILPGHVLLPFPLLNSSQLPLMYISNAAFRSWTLGDWTRVEELLTEEIMHPSNSSHHAHALAHRALVRTRLGQWNMAIDDAKKSVEIQRSVIGHIANAIACVGNGDHERAIRIFDLVFTVSFPAENDFLLLIKAIILFQCGKHDDAISRVDDLIDITDDQSSYITVRAQMFLLLGNTSSRKGDNERGIALLRRAREAILVEKSPHLVIISLIVGWDFDQLDLAIQLHFQASLKPLEDSGDGAVQAKNPREAISLYSTALSMHPSHPAGLLVKRSKAHAMLELWEDALKDADEAIETDPLSPWGYERRHAALHALKLYGEAIDAFTRMFSLIQDSLNPDIHQLGKKYVSPVQLEMSIDNTVRGVFKICPLVLIDVKSGRMCDGRERMHTFKSEPQFQELLSSMTQQLDDGRILQVVAKYFQYVTLSHVWDGREPSFQDVSLANSVWDLDSSPLNEKLRKFCEVVRGDGYRWAWSDTCCIDKTISTVLNRSLTVMYKWYEASAATLVLLATVPSPSTLGDLTNSIWMTRAWTAQELLAPKVIRFYDRDWKPYLGDLRSNHKESPEIMQELADAIGTSRETITAFNPDNLSVREKLRLASTRNATVEEDVAYSLIGIFKSDIRPHYGEGDAAVGHLLEEIVARSGDVTVLAWTGNSSPYNSCLPATLAVYSQTLRALPAIEDAEMDLRVGELRCSHSQAEAMIIYEQVTRLPPARFANRRLYLPCVIFAVKRLSVQTLGADQENRYRARVPGIGHVEFETSDRLSLMEPRKLVFVHPWIRDLRGPHAGFTWGGASDGDEHESDEESVSVPKSQLQATAPSARTDGYTRALRLVVRLRQPFHALLLQQQPDGEFKRVATEHDIVVPGLEPRVNFARDIHADVVEIL